MTEREIREIDCLIAEKVFGWVSTWPTSGIHPEDPIPENFVPLFRGWPSKEHKERGEKPEVPRFLNREL